AAAHSPFLSTCLLVTIKAEVSKHALKPPKISCTVISRYYNKYYEVYKNQKSYLTMLPDVLMWRKEENKLFYASKLASYDIE
ncbi:hypothetical protein, partial [uncultured Desulfovibrio sp.]|uniref:hypothetical protein n=1 Tax=uncultured Desulfovibrio sp. TaxID=167968 RepID=UPI002628B439